MVGNDKQVALRSKINKLAKSLDETSLDIIIHQMERLITSKKKISGYEQKYQSSLGNRPIYVISYDLIIDDSAEYIDNETRLLDKTLLEIDAKSKIAKPLFIIVCENYSLKNNDVKFFKMMKSRFTKSSTYIDNVIFMNKVPTYYDTCINKTIGIKNPIEQQTTINVSSLSEVSP